MRSRKVKVNILNNISTIILVLCFVGGLCYYFSSEHKKYVRVYNHLELKHNFKNCMIVGKSDADDNYTLLLYNPVLHDHNRDNVILYIDYKVRVPDYTYFNLFIGDTIK